MFCNNQIFCILAGIFLVSMFYMAFVVDKNISKTLLPYLTQEQITMYNTIQEERKRNHMYGIIGGICISIGLIVFIKYIYIKPIKIHTMCFIITVSYITMYFYYNMASKSDLMIVHLDNKDARLQWQKNYKNIKYHYNISMLIGILFVLLTNNMICK